MKRKQLLRTNDGCKQGGLQKKHSPEPPISESEANFRAYFDSIAFGSAQIDSEGRFIRVNDHFCQITGYSREDLVNRKSPIDLNHPEDRESDRESQERFFRGNSKAVYRAEKRYVRKDGSPVWVRVTASKVFARSGKFLYTAGVIEDISEEKKNETSLRQTAERLKLALDAGQMGTFDWNISTGQVHWSPETERIWGLPAGGYDGTYDQWKRMVHPDDRRMAEAHAQKAIEDPKGQYAFEHRIIRPDGAVRWIFAKALTVRDPAGKAVRMVGLNMDITERKQMEEDLRRSKEELKREKTALEHKTIALAELIENLEKNKETIKDTVTLNVNEILLPLLEKMGQQGASPKYLKMIRLHLESLVSSFGRMITEKSVEKMSSRQFEISKLLKEGLSTGEIVEMLQITQKTVEKHRRDIRKKLGITGKKINLAFYLKKL